eukprot:SAG11_NODE_252_length_11593_cov_7.436663_2_plen_611_part_00
MVVVAPCQLSFAFPYASLRGVGYGRGATHSVRTARRCRRQRLRLICCAVIAGQLWVPMWDAELEKASADGALVSQIKKALPAEALAELNASDSAAAAAAEEEEAQDGDELRGDMLAELERLRSDLAQVNVGSAAAAAAGLAGIPSTVPELPHTIGVTNEMEHLQRLLVSESSQACIGCLGMGGAGKTVIASWLCRQEKVRKRFAQIVWVTLGQTPNMVKCLNSVYFQLCGADLPTEASLSERTMAVSEAMAARCVCFVVDDLWVPEHLDHFGAKADSRSRMLISTRVRSNLVRCDVVNVGLPDTEEAVAMLMLYAGIVPDSVPPAARAVLYDVVHFVKKLPLAISLAGKMLKSKMKQNLPSGGDDWSDVLELLKHEFTAAETTEEAVIRSSLQSIKPEMREQVELLFISFALIPEDTAPPPRILSMCYEAVLATRQQQQSHGRSAPVSILNTRRFLKILRDHSLVLGSTDKPQLHDIVLDYCQAQHTELQLRDAHRNLVLLFREARPPGGWDAIDLECDVSDRVTAYICAESEFHIAGAWDSHSQWDNPSSQPLEWLLDYPGRNLDAIPLGCASHLGQQKMVTLVDRAEASGRFLDAANMLLATAMITGA